MIQWKLSHLLAAHNLTAYRLAEETKGIVNRNTVYSIARGDATRVDLGTLFGVIRTLTRLTGQPVTPNDLLEVIEEPLESMDEESKAWLDSAAYDMAASLAAIEKDVPPEQLKAWLAANHKAAKPVKYVAGVGFVEVTA